MDSIYRQAHNDYLQFLSENGIAALFLMIALIGRLLERTKKFLKRAPDGLSVLQIGILCSLFSLALHSLTDFGLQIPAIAYQGSIVAGLFFAQYHAEQHETKTKG
jgi:O-antigen ligase